MGRRVVHLQEFEHFFIQKIKDETDNKAKKFLSNTYHAKFTTQQKVKYIPTYADQQIPRLCDAKHT